jgi:hypothetical protein
MTLVGVLVMTMEGFHSKDSWWAKEGDSYDYGKDFIVRILDRRRERGGGQSRNLFSISLFFQHKFYNFFSKNVLNKKCQKC